ncbi:teashirt homolog 1 [Lampetra planeri]
MPRRKQQAPRRVAAYLSEEDLKSGEFEREEGDGADTEDGSASDYQCTDEEMKEELGEEDAGEELKEQRRDKERDDPQLREEPGELADDSRKDDSRKEELREDRKEEAKDHPQPPPCQDPSRAETSSRDADSESQFSESSDRLADFESAAAKEEPKKKENGVPIGHATDSLAQMKAAYASLLANPYWSALSYSLNQPIAATVAAAAASTATAAATTTTVNTDSCTSSTSSTTSASNAANHRFDWHQAALAKSLQQTMPVAMSHHHNEPSLFSTVQLYRQSGKIYGSIFTGASKFRCKDCSAAYDTLVELTVHMNETGHYRDDNHDKDSSSTRRWSKPRKRSLMEMEGKEEAQKVLKCMYCGHSFESLQDLSVHMIKTKHYQKVPLKEPVSAVTSSKLTPAMKKRPYMDPLLASTPDTRGGAAHMVTGSSDSAAGMSHKSSNPYVTPNNRYGYQNGASYAWQFEAKKSQILKCMECGSSHDTLQQLTAHMMVTGHFMKVTNSNIKKGKHVIFDPLAEVKIQSVPLPPTNISHAHITPANSPAKPLSSPSSTSSKPLLSPSRTGAQPVMSPPGASGRHAPCPADSPPKLALSPPSSPVKPLASPARSPPPSAVSPVNSSEKLSMEELKIEDKELKMEVEQQQEEEEEKKEEKEKSDKEKKDKRERKDYDLSSQYLREEDLEDTSTTGLDILKSLENTVASAINKAQNGTPTWGGYPSIHAAYQLPGAVKSVIQNPAQETPLKPAYGANVKPLAPKAGSAAPVPCSRSPPAGSPPPLKNNVHAMEELVKKVSENLKKVEGKKIKTEVKSPSSVSEASSPCRSDDSHDSKRELRQQIASKKPAEKVSANGSARNELFKNGTNVKKEIAVEKSSSLNIITDHPSEESLVNPLSALQSIMNLHLGKISKPPLPVPDPMAMLYKMSSGMLDKLVSAPALQSRNSDPVERCYYQTNLDQPIDLTKSKKAPKSPKPSPGVLMSPSASGENALSDMSDMVKNLTGRLTPKPPTPASTTSERSETDASSSTLEEVEEVSSTHKRKGRQSNWNPQHLLILQAQFVACLHQTPEGKYVISDLSPQDRAHISKFTGLGMTTISHWLANVKYQLRRTGGTKFLKHMDTGHPVFYCNDCASQFRTPSTYVSHLETHLGFHLRDLSRLSADQICEQMMLPKLPLARSPSLLAGGSEEDVTGVTLQCKLCSRSFASRHAVKLHLSKAHGKSPEDHLLYVTELEKP